MSPDDPNHHPSPRIGLSQASLGGESDRLIAHVKNGLSYPILQGERSVKNDYYSNTLIYHLDEILTHLKTRDGNPVERILELGISRGSQSIGIALLTSPATRILGIDIDPQAAVWVGQNATLNGVAERIAVRIGDMFTPLAQDERFDLIFGTMPINAVAPEERQRYRAEGFDIDLDNIDGGDDGRYFIDLMIRQAAPHLTPRGSLLFIQPSFTGVDKSLALMAEHGLVGEILVEREWKLQDTLYTYNHRHYIERACGYRFPTNDQGDEVFYLVILKGRKA
ncbi:MAG: 50S ribosomal protein L11 methyltransferase [Candidatus Competibacterales bacterium]